MGSRAGRTVHQAQEGVPAGVRIDGDVAAQDEDLGPRLAGDSLGRVAQRVVGRQEAGPQDPERDDEHHAERQQPHEGRDTR